MKLTMNAIDMCTDILECMMAAEIRHVTIEDDHIGALSIYGMHDCPSTKAEVIKEVQMYWSFRDEVEVIDWIAMKGRKIIIPATLQKEPEQWHVHEMGIEKTRLLACESVYWINVNGDIIMPHTL